MLYQKNPSTERHYANLEALNIGGGTLLGQSLEQHYPERERPNMNYSQTRERHAFTWVLAMGLHFLICTTMCVVQITKKNGRIIAVDLSPRCLRDLVHLSSIRPGLVPVLGDARKLNSWGIMVPNKVDWLLQDVSQAGQATIFIDAVKKFLKPSGKALLSLKAASERFSEGGEREVFNNVREELEKSGLTILEQIDLHGLEDNHCLYFVTN